MLLQRIAHVANRAGDVAAAQRRQGTAPLHWHAIAPANQQARKQLQNVALAVVIEALGGCAAAPLACTVVRHWRKNRCAAAPGIQRRRQSTGRILANEHG
ncbi:hypothetical protein D3C78_1667770 [compost metagenome]